jgi:crotonobetainyl-CoA:carnitine CoA-transferase CaiB-like acyl-CoA transferase
MAGPLSGYRILDLTSMVSGPLATILLADQGADVIKVEHRDGGDYVRSTSNRRNGHAAAFLNARLELTQGVLRDGSTAHWLARLEAERVPCAPVLTRTQMIAHPQIQASGTITEYRHRVAGVLRQARPAAQFDATPATPRRGAPALGEHSREILTGPGMSAEEVRELEAAGIVKNSNGQPA